MPKVSIDLCCYNAEPYLEETLRGVEAQTYRDWELVVVNDGSTDGTEALAREYAAKGLPLVYHAQPNAGLGAARNKALELSSGEFIAILDQDDVWERGKLERQMALFARPQTGFVGCDARFMACDGRLLGRYSDRNPMRRGKVLRELFLYDFIACAGVVMRRSAIEAAGGFFRGDFRIAEEYELFLRLAERSEFDFAEEALVRIRVHAASAGWDASRERAEMRLAYAECLARNPALIGRLGPKALAVKKAGLWLSPELAGALRGEPASLGTRLRAEALHALARLGPGAVDRVLSLKRSISRHKARR